MFSNNKKQYLYAAAICLVGLFVSVTVLAVRPAQAQETSYDLDRIKAKKQSVEVLDAEGNFLGTGEFQAQISTGRGGQITGQASLKLGYVLTQSIYDSVNLYPTNLERILYEDGVPVGLVLSGRIEETRDGRTYSTSGGIITLKRGITSNLEIWQWEKTIDTGSPFDKASLAAETELRLRADAPPIFCYPFGENCQPAPP